MSSPNNHHSIPGPEDIFRQVLPNGITLLTRSNFNSASVVISGYVASGSVYDPLEKLGLAHFSALGLTRGTQNADFQTIFDRLESVGASLGFGASVHNTSFGGRSLAEDLPLLLSTLADCLMNPTFPVEQMERLRAQLLTGLAIRAQDTADMAALEFDAQLFPNHAYGRPEDGFTHTISAITQPDLVAFHRKYYRPEQMILVIVGAVQPAKAADLVARYLGGWLGNCEVLKPALPAIHPPKDSIRKHIRIPGKSQADIIMGTLGPKRKAPEYLPALLGNSILGQFGMMGRIGESVREKAGLAYYASTSLNAWPESGSWEVSAGVNPKNVERAIDLVKEELHRFVTELVTEAELEDNKSNFIGRLPLMLESNSGVANSLLNLERFDLGLDYLQRYPQRIRAISREEILAAARKYIDPEKLVVISAGPGKKGKAG
ncbi:MAG TPA: pitrilysin family protein [Anaerolineaceae bacterium]|nr:pitrilysin family protein [Anaerolineaceae bacterium]